MPSLRQLEQVQARDTRMHTVQQSQWFIDVVARDIKELGAPVLQVLTQHFGEQAYVLRKLAVNILSQQPTVKV